jgi:hypothetical protein
VTRSQTKFKKTIQKPNELLKSVIAKINLAWTEMNFEDLIYSKFDDSENEQVIITMTNDLEDFFKTEEIFETEMIENFEKTLGNVFETEFDWRMLIETFSRKTCCQDQVSRMDLLPLISDIRSAVAGILKQSSLNGNRLVLVQTELQVFMKCIFRNELDVVFQKSFINIVSLTAVDPHVCSRLIKALMSDITSNQIKRRFHI